MLELFKKKPLILFYSSRRGGSTILAQVLAQEPYVGYIDQPFDLWKPETHRGKVIASYLPNKSRSQFFELNEEEYLKVDHYLNTIYKGKLKELSNKTKATQFVLKIVNAHGLIDELPTMVPSKTIVMLRHPFSQALSVIRNGWGTCEMPFLESKKWTDKYLTQDQVDVAKNVVKKGDYFEKAVLNWCLEWLYPIHFSKTEHLKLYYEDLVTNGVQTINEVYSFLGYKNISGALQELNRPSKSSVYSTEIVKQSIVSHNTKTLVSGWREQVSEQQQAKGQEILTVFNMNMYNIYSDLPVL